MTSRKLLLFGLQRSGTNYLETVLRKRYRVRFVNDRHDRAAVSHKHARLYADKHLIPEPQYANDVVVDDLASYEALLPKLPDKYVVISKDPYSWLLSYHRWARRCGWPTPDHDYIEEYNAFYGTMLDLASGNDRMRFVRYGDLIVDELGELAALERDLGLERRFSLRQQAKVIRKVPVSRSFSEDDRAYYGERRFLDDLSDELLASVDKRLDRGVTDRLGYGELVSDVSLRGH